jgi:hypothetical protein
MNRIVFNNQFPANPVHPVKKLRVLRASASNHYLRFPKVRMTISTPLIFRYGWMAPPLPAATGFFDSTALRSE